MELKNNLAMVWPEVLIAVNRNMKITSIQGDPVKIWGFKAPELVDKPLLTLFDDHSHHQISSLFKVPNPQFFVFKTKGTNKNSNSFEIEVMLFQLSEQFVLMVKETTSEIRRINFLDLLMPLINHELKNPLNSITGLSKLLLQKSPREDQKELLETLNFSAKNLEVMINDILDYGKIATGDFKIEKRDFDFRLLINSIKNSFLPSVLSKNVLFEVNIHKEVPETICADSTRISQILYNIIGNAFKFTKKGSIKVDISADSIKNELQIKILDTGIGIPEDKLEKIFLPFEQADLEIAKTYGGLGLGLSIIKTLLQLMNGDIKVESKLGVGSSFIINLPYTPAKGNGTSKVMMSANKSVESIRLLYVEDQLSNQLLMKELCARINVPIDLAENGAQALELIKKEEYTAIFLDVNLENEDGLLLGEKIRENINNSLEIIVVTGDNISKEVLVKYGINDILLKPIQQEHFYPLLMSIIQNVEVVNMNKNVNNFSMLDNLYNDKPNEYLALLKVMFQEFQQFKIKLFESLKKKNVKEFRKIVHSMKSNLIAMGMLDFVDYLELLKDQVSKLKKDTTQKEVLNKASTYFDHINEGLNRKIDDLKSNI